MTSMPFEPAREFVKTNVAAAATPALTDVEVDMCLLEAAIVDAAGRVPSASGWEPTVLVPRAMVSACNLKLAKAAGLVDTSSDGTSMSLSQVTSNYTALRRMWRARLVG